MKYARMIRTPPESLSLSGRGLRKQYPVFVSYMTRFDAGKLQRETGIPASLVHRLREGSVVKLSPSTVDKFQLAYYDYFESRLRKNGFTESQTEELINYAKPSYIREQIKINIDSARKIAEARRERDAHCPKFNTRWHTLKDILWQMSIDNSRSNSDWALIAQFGSPKSKTSHHKKAEYRRPPGRPKQYEH